MCLSNSEFGGVNRAAALLQPAAVLRGLEVHWYVPGATITYRPRVWTVIQVPNKEVRAS